MVELDITHNFIAGEGTLVDDGDWNDTHKVSGGGTLRVPQLIEEKVITSPVASVTFSGLNGDSDGDYFLIGKVKLATGNNSSVKLTINGDTGNNYYNNRIYMENNNGINGEYYNTSSVRVSIGVVNGVSNHLFELKIQANTTFRRFIQGNSFGDKNTYEARKHSLMSVWNSSANITSIEIIGDTNIDVGSIIKLYRMVDLVLE